jgi:hypothetical protein
MRTGDRPPAEILVAAMSQRLDKIRLAITRAPSILKDGALSLACKLLLPLSTTCKVCNMLRGMAIGIGIGGALSIGVVLAMLLRKGAC